MDLQNALTVAVLVFLVLLVTIRSERRARRIIVLLVPMPGFYLLVRWAIYRNAWGDFGLGIGIAILGVLVWWLILGRRLPSTENPMKVWEKDDPF
jgi:hypothetical protein